MDGKCLKTFVYAAESGSFSKAAQVQGYTQPTVSFHIRQLEEELGVRLFDRVRHSITLTDDGKKLLAYAYQVRDMEQELIDSLHDNGQVRGMVKIVTADSLVGVLFGTEFARFRETYPGILLQVESAVTQEMFSRLDHNEADLLFTPDRPIYGRNYVVACDVPVKVHFICAAGHSLAGREHISLKEITEYPLLMTETGMSYRRELEDILDKHSLMIKPVLEMGDVNELCKLTADGAGLSFLPDYVTRPYVREGRICLVPVDECDVEMQIQLIYRQDKRVFPAMERMIAYIRSTLEELDECAG